MLFLGLPFLVSGQESVHDLLLKDYSPASVYKIPATEVFRAKYPVIDMHAHPNAHSDGQLATWIKTMDEVGIQKSIILTYSTGSRFDSIYAKYAPYGDRFEVWCGFDYTGNDLPDWSSRAVKELERCYKVGARGVGELGDKGLGELYSRPSPGYGIHIDDPGMKPLIKRCGELKMPISIHVADPIWMYEPMDSTNDGLMNAFTWRVDQSVPGLLGHDELVATLERAVRDNPGTTFIACHIFNCSHDLEKAGSLLGKYPNLYADIAARYAETAAIPRAMEQFCQKYQDKVVYGTDMGMNASMYRLTFRILETNDEHFYAHQYFSYHWPLYGFGLSDETLEKIYGGNARRILERK